MPDRPVNSSPRGVATRGSGLLVVAVTVAIAAVPLHTARAQESVLDASRTSGVVDPLPEASRTAHSVAHSWMEAALFAVRNDFARPPVHARNLYHLAGAMYDAWALFDTWAAPLFMESDAHSACAMDSVAERALATLRVAPDAEQQRDRVIAQTAWRLLRYRYQRADASELLHAHLDGLAAEQGLSTGRGESRPAALLGARVAACVIGMGRRDNANEDSNYTNLDYEAVNPPLDPLLPGNPTLQRPSRWQPLSLGEFIDQAGKPSRASEFVGADWGQVSPFALRDGDRTMVFRDGRAMPVYHDPGPPPTWEKSPQAYALQFALVAIWSGHLDPERKVMVDISPRARSGALAADDLSTDPIEQLGFFDLEGGQRSLGDSLEPAGSRPPLMVPLGDYARVIAEYWADGPDSETPPGHWFSLYNDHVSGHPDLERRAGGKGRVLHPLAFDVLAYLALGGALHDAAIAAWSSKGAYDFVRPVSAIRFLADQPAGQGLPMVPGMIERIEQGEALAGTGGLQIGATRLFGWLGPAAIADPGRDVAGSDWMLAREWWPYQRPNFVTPPFAGYVSGHSTFSRAAAVALEGLTGSPFWPGGGAGFTAPANDFLVFERGPGVDVPLQWATYRDAADQSGLSRIWGGIHPPADDLAGRRIGARVGEAAWQRAFALFSGPDAIGSSIAAASRPPDVASQAAAAPAGTGGAGQASDSAPGPAPDSTAVADASEGEVGTDRALADVPDADGPAPRPGGCATGGTRRGADAAFLLLLGGATIGVRRRRRPA